MRVWLHIVHCVVANQAHRTVEWATGRGELRERLEKVEEARDEALGNAGYWKAHAAIYQRERDSLQLERMYRHDSDQLALNLLERGAAKGFSQIHDEVHELLVETGRRER
jgi:hypothetical protein